MEPFCLPCFSRDGRDAEGTDVLSLTMDPESAAYFTLLLIGPTLEQRRGSWGYRSRESAQQHVKRQDDAGQHEAKQDKERKK